MVVVAIVRIIVPGIAVAVEAVVLGVIDVVGYL